MSQRSRATAPAGDAPAVAWTDRLGRTRRCNRWTFAPIEQATGEQDARSIARTLDTSTSNVYRWRSQGLTERAADELAIRMGYHPLELWPDYYDTVKQS